MTIAYKKSHEQTRHTIEWLQRVHKIIPFKSLLNHTQYIIRWILCKKKKIINFIQIAYSGIKFIHKHPCMYNSSFFFVKARMAWTAIICWYPSAMDCYHQQQWVYRKNGKKKIGESLVSHRLKCSRRLIRVVTQLRLFGSRWGSQTVNDDKKPIE